jgi:hypothetical protein
MSRPVISLRGGHGRTLEAPNPRRLAMKGTLALAVVVLAVPGTLRAQGNLKALTGSGLLGYFLTTVPVEAHCAGGQVVSPDFPYCSPGTKHILGRNEEQIWMPVDFTAPVATLLDGPITFEVNCNFNTAFRGPCWGTFTWESGGGIWEGQWVSSVMDLMTYESVISMVGFGTGGAIDGKQLKVDGGSAPGDWYITVDVRIK